MQRFNYIIHYILRTKTEKWHEEQEKVIRRKYRKKRKMARIRRGTCPKGLISAKVILNIYYTRGLKLSVVAPKLLQKTEIVAHQSEQIARAIQSLYIPLRPVVQNCTNIRGP